MFLYGVLVKSFSRYILIYLAVYLQGCAIVSNSLLGEVNVCETERQTFRFDLVHQQTVRGSFHTPFDYGNKSTNDKTYTFETQIFKGEIHHYRVEAWKGTEPVDIESGSIIVKNKSIKVNIYLKYNIHVTGVIPIKENNGSFKPLKCEAVET